MSKAEATNGTTATLNVRMPASLRRRLARAADRENRSMNAQIVNILTEALPPRRRRKAA